jgi:hypothetical protein
MVVVLRHLFAGEFDPQRGQGPGCVGAHGARRTADGLGDLVVGEAAEVPQYQDGSLPAGELGQFAEQLVMSAVCSAWSGLLPESTSAIGTYRDHLRRQDRYSLTVIRRRYASGLSAAPMRAQFRCALIATSWTTSSARWGEPHSTVANRSSGTSPDLVHSSKVTSSPLPAGAAPAYTSTDDARYGSAESG